MRILTTLVLAVALPVLAYGCDGEVINTTADSNNSAEVVAEPVAAGQANEKTEDVPNNPRHRALMGKLVETKEMSLQGMDAKHVLAKIETPSGHIVIADLGTREDVKNAKLTVGEQVEVYGVVGRLNNRPLLVAEQMGEVINIKRTSNEVPISTSFHGDDALNTKNDKGEKAEKTEKVETNTELGEKNVMKEKPQHEMIKDPELKNNDTNFEKR